MKKEKEEPVLEMHLLLTMYSAINFDSYSELYNLMVIMVSSEHYHKLELVSPLMPRGMAFIVQCSLSTPNSVCLPVEFFRQEVSNLMVTMVSSEHDKKLDLVSHLMPRGVAFILRCSLSDSRYHYLRHLLVPPC